MCILLYSSLLLSYTDLKIAFVLNYLTFTAPLVNLKRLDILESADRWCPCDGWQTLAVTCSESEFQQEQE